MFGVRYSKKINKKIQKITKPLRNDGIGTKLKDYESKQEK